MDSLTSFVSSEVRKIIPAARMLCIVLSFNGKEDTVACLQSLLASPCPGLEVLVVDNASEYGVVDFIKAACPSAEILCLPENLGWAGGNNTGIQIGLERGFDWICLMNNDLVFPSGQAKALFDTVSDLPACLLHPTIYYWDEPEVAQLHPGRDSAPDHAPTGIWHGKTSMNFAYGACLAVHRDVFNSIGLLDERFFLQLEETDFHYRASKQGFNSVCDLGVKVFHKESRAFGGKRVPIKTYYSVRNSLLLSEKKHGSFKERLSDIKSIYWSLSRIAGSDKGVDCVGKIEFVRWLFSKSGSAKAVRLGITDYIFRSFGKISTRKHLMLQQKRSNLIAKTDVARS
ncbi:glycosyltransferase family 2 protein [Noviherbaspirillum soli]|uniref:glycosyltransferase family 2 protein n=1 Tax=Noviherbaspirillum soli TaxID=1064518 RepID=UPI001889CC59|nr:glycosyltransferase family 2 protein [Noviherbaspirillum soli]